MSADKTMVLTSQGAAKAIPKGNAFPTFDKDGNMTMISSSPLCLKGSVKDLNEATDLGIYYPAKDGVNVPNGLTSNTSDYVIVLSSSGVYGTQIYIPLTANAAYIRNFTSGTFSAWYKFEGVRL